MLVVDACQGRFEQSMLDDVLKKQSCVLITGSKFYRGPPFSGAVFVAPSVMKQLMEKEKEGGVDMPQGLKTFVG